MDEETKNSILYICTMIEYVGRVTKNRRSDIINKLTDENLLHQLKHASVNHSLPFEQVCDEWIADYNITKGDYDCVKDCKYAVPSVTSIGKVYQNLIKDTINDKSVVETIRQIFSSFICDEITNFNSNVYYSNPDYIKCSYENGSMLE